MNGELFDNFIKKFIRKPLQERLVFEFNNPKKYYNFLSRFNAPLDIMTNEYLIFKSNKITIEEVLKIIDEHYNVKNSALIISMGFNMSKTIKCEDAVKGVFENLGTEVVICGDELVFIKTEFEMGSPTKYVFYRPNKK